MDHSPHCIFTADGAHRLAREAGFAEVDPAGFVHERERLLHQRVKAGETGILEQVWRGIDTVGALALDRDGNLAAGNSTGGTLNKALGRVGDAPLIGSGFYADNERGAFVCTGWGEPIMRSAMGMVGLGALSGHDPDTAARMAVDHLARRTSGFGGLLLMTPDGRVGAAFNTGRMAFCHDGSPVVR